MSNEHGFRAIKEISRQLFAHAKGSVVLDEIDLRDAKAKLVSATASIAFGSEALSLKDIRRVLDVDQSVFRVGLSTDSKRGDHPKYGYARAISGLWRITPDEYDDFWRLPERDWDELAAKSFERSQVCPDDVPSYIGINVAVDLAHIAGKGKTMACRWGMFCLTQHMRELTGRIRLSDETQPKRHIHWITTVELGSESHGLAKSVDMEVGTTTTYNWTKYRLDLSKWSSLDAESLKQLQRFAKFINGEPQLLLV